MRTIWPIGANLTSPPMHLSASGQHSRSPIDTSLFCRRDQFKSCNINQANLHFAEDVLDLSLDSCMTNRRQTVMSSLQLKGERERERERTMNKNIFISPLSALSVINHRTGARNCEKTRITWV